MKKTLLNHVFARTFLVAIGVLFASVASAYPENNQYFRFDDYSSWVNENKTELLKVVTLFKAEDNLFAIEYADNKLKSRGGHTDKPKIYTGANTKAYRAVLSEGYVTMMLKKKDSVGLLLPEKHRCSYKNCTVEVLYSKSTPDLPVCQHGILSGSEGKCVFDMGESWYLQYFWR